MVVALAITVSLVSKSCHGLALRTHDGVAQSRGQAPEYVHQWARGLDIGMLAYGSPTSPVTVLVLHDYQCPFCRVFSETLDSVISLVPGAARVMLIDYPLDYHPFSTTAAHAAACAHELDVLPAWVDAAYRNQDSLGLKSWSGIAEEIGVADPVTFDQCVDSKPASHRIQRSLEFGEAIGAEETPTVVINGWRYHEPPSPALLVAVIESTTRMGDGALFSQEGHVSLRLDSLPLGRRLGIHEELRIGGEMDDLPLATVGQVLVGKEMSLVVSQPALFQVLIFDSLGQLSATLGHRGDGPGEFQDIFSIGTLGDTLYVTDRGRRTVTYFMDGQVLGSRRWIADIAPRFAGNSGLRLFSNVPEVIVGENRALVRPNLAMSAPETESEVSVHVPIWLVNGESQVLDTPVWDDMSRVVISVRYRGAVFQAVAPLQLEPFTRLSPGGNGAVTVSYPSGRLTLTGIEPLGDTVFVRELEPAHIPLSASWIRRAVLDMLVFPEVPEGEEEPIRLAFEKKFRRSGFLPEYLPPVTALFVGQDGSIWLRREETEGEMIDYSVLWRDGTPRGTIAIPALQRVVAARDGLMVAVEVNELGIPTLVRYRVQH